MIDDILEELVLEICDDKIKPSQWDVSKLNERFSFLFNIPSPFETKNEITESNRKLDSQEIFNKLRSEAKAHYNKITEEKESKLLALRDFSQSEQNVIQFSDNIPTYNEIERRTILEAVDYFWNNHLQDMETLREGIGLRGYGQKNPLYEYQKEGFSLFETTLASIKESVLRRLFYEQILDVNVLLNHIAEEEKRRHNLLAESSLSHGDTASHTDINDEDTSSNTITYQESLDDARARREQLKRERRKHR
jgi:preprotein translocase subunit SecA